MMEIINWGGDFIWIIRNQPPINDKVPLIFFLCLTNYYFSISYRSNFTSSIFLESLKTM